MTRAGSGDIDKNSGTVSGSCNLIGSGGSGGITNAIDGNIVRRSLADLDLGPLADNTPSGVAAIAIYDSVQGGAFSLLLNVTPGNSSATFTGRAGDSYRFYSIATDNADFGRGDDNDFSVRMFPAPTAWRSSLAPRRCSRPGPDHGAGRHDHRRRGHAHGAGGFLHPQGRKNRHAGVSVDHGRRVGLFASSLNHRGRVSPSGRSSCIARFLTSRIPRDGSAPAPRHVCAWSRARWAPDGLGGDRQRMLAPLWLYHLSKSTSPVARTGTDQPEQSPSHGAWHLLALLPRTHSRRRRAEEIGEDGLAAA